MSSPLAPSISGALLIDKPLQLTSSDVVTRLKWALINHGYAIKGFRIGHGGTLDPFATGVLAILFGEATKLADCYLHSVKAYSGLIQLGTSTETGDHTGAIKAQLPVPPLDLSQWQSLADQFVLTPYFQTPPMYSAKKKDGKALYELARQGIEIEREPILKKIDSFRLGEAAEKCLSFQVTCESGTYVRVLAEDLADHAHTVSHLLELRRTRSSDLLLENCSTLDETLQLLESGAELKLLKNFTPLSRLASHLPSIAVIDAEAAQIKQGQHRSIAQILSRASGENTSSRYLLVKLKGTPLALLERANLESPFRLQRVFND
jgi:tRNA pseudouridine55 synthase